MIKERTCTFTGNRPSKLPWGEDETDFRCVAIKRRIREEIIACIQNGYDTFVCGMAQGGDTYFAEEVIALKKDYDIKLSCAIPCLEQTNGWSESAKNRYNDILAVADEQTVLSAHYTRWCMHARNRYMVDISSKIIVLDYNGEDGGSVYTKNYAKKRGLVLVDLI